eukprot:908539-Pelagomonas_calceolata.AAC.2
MDNAIVLFSWEWTVPCDCARLRGTVQVQVRCCLRAFARTVPCMRFALASVACFSGQGLSTKFLSPVERSCLIEAAVGSSRKAFRNKRHSLYSEWSFPVQG